MNNTMAGVDIESIIEKVLKKIEEEGGLESQGSEEIIPQNASSYSLSSTPEVGQPGVFKKMEDAIQASWEAFQAFRDVPIEKRKQIIAAIRLNIARPDFIKQLAQVAVKETGMGRVEDKIKKNLLAIHKTPGVEDITSTAYSGDDGLTLVERAPYGVIGSITPSTNPSETIICNGIGMLSAGNTVVFNPHPGAKGVSLMAMSEINRIIEKEGGPANLLTAVAQPSLETGEVLFHHPKIRLLVVTGGPAVVQVAMNSGKKAIAAGPGNPPVVVDETADIESAAKSLIIGASADNNILCTAEKEAFVVDKIYGPFKRALLNGPTHLLSKRETERLLTTILAEGKDGVGCSEPKMNRKYVGKDAATLAKAIGLKIDPQTRLLLAEVEPSHPLIMLEQLTPFFPLAKVSHVEEGIQWALRAEKGNRHTASMYSLNVRNMTRMARLMDCSIFVKNGPTLAGLGMGGEGFTTFTIASPTGEGLTRARTFTRKRRCTLVDYFRII